MTCIKIGTSYSDPFKPNKGVRQGCVLSPLLFNIFLADLQNELDSCNDNVKLNDNKEISCLMWADDILILSESESESEREDGLQRKLNTLGVYCVTNKLSVNTNKTECMIFNKTGRLMGHKFFFKDTSIRNVRKYKYLGFLVKFWGNKKWLRRSTDQGIKSSNENKNCFGASVSEKHNKYYSSL